MEGKVAADFDERVWQIGEKSYQRDIQTHYQWMKHETLGYFCFAGLCIALAWRYFCCR